jgi:esterase
MRNHGLSAFAGDDLRGMAQDLLDTLDDHRLKSHLYWSFNGRKSGDGADRAGAGAHRGLVAIDIAPVDYHVRRDEIFAAINAVTDAGAATRQQAARSCASILQEEGVIQFLLKSRWTASGALTCRCCGISIRISSAGKPFRLAASDAVYSRRQLPYVTDAYRDTLLAQFPRRGRTSSPAPGTGCMRKNRRPSCAPFVVI